MTMSGVRLMAIALASCLLAGRAAALPAAERPWLEVSVPTVVDGSLAPDGQHVMSIVAHTVPGAPRDVRDTSPWRKAS